MANPDDTLDSAFQRASQSLDNPIINDAEISGYVELICRNEGNRACTRFLLACSLAKAFNPAVDIRKPYTDIKGLDVYSGRTFDERYITPFITKNRLPCNDTTAFLTPAFRAKNIILTTDIDLKGRPSQIYKATLLLLSKVQEERVLAEDLLSEIIRMLLVIKNENQHQLQSLLNMLRANQKNIFLELSSEMIVNLVQQHLESPQSSRLPVLVIAAIYKTAKEQLNESFLPLQSHNAADKQTGASGDLEITLIDETNVITCYEMKMKRVIIEDIDHALNKIKSLVVKPDNYIFITTDEIAETVKNYAAGLYLQSGIEFAILDCITFLRYFLHLFHRLRIQFLENYQQLILVEPESAVRQSLKESFLILRRAAEVGVNQSNEET